MSASLWNPGGSVNFAMASAISFIQRGVNAITRNVAAKLYESVSVADFGAVPDGTLEGLGTNNTAAINLAIAAAVSLGFKRVYFPAGAPGFGYRYTAPIILGTSGITLYGDGGGGNSQSLTGSAGVVGRGSFSGTEDASATRLIADFNGGDCIWIQNQGCRVQDMAISRSYAAYAVAKNILDNGIRIYARDEVGAYVTARNAKLFGLRITNQPGDGVVLSHDVVTTEINDVQVQCVKRHGFHVIGAAYFGRVNITIRPGQIRFINCGASRTGGLGIKVGELTPISNIQIPYRVEVHNMENFYNLVDTTLAIDGARKAGNCFFGENIWVQVSAFDGRSEFVTVGTNGDPTHACLHVAGLHHNYNNQRAVQTTTPSIYVDSAVNFLTTTSRGIKFENLYAVNTITGGAGYFNPVVQQQVGCRGVAVSCHSVISGITTLINKEPGTMFYENFNGFESWGTKQVYYDSINCDSNITGNTVTAEQSHLGPIKHNSAAISLADDVAGYIEAIGLMYGIITINGNTSAAESAVIAFRAGDASAFATVLAASANIAVGTGALTTGAATGVDLKLNIYADTATNRIYIKNRTGALRGYSVSFQGVAVTASSSGVYLDQFVAV